MSSIRQLAAVFTLCGALGLLLAAHSAAESREGPPSPDAHFRVAKTLYADNFEHGLGEWRIEAQRPGKIAAVPAASGGALDIDVPAGVTLWFKPELKGPVMISYDAAVISAGGPNDRVSDLNCFWMAANAAPPYSPLATPRSGAFATYNNLRTYYVGLGGNGNTTTRFRRYIGDAQLRPMLPQNDLRSREKMIVPNKTVTIRLIAAGDRIEYYRDNERIFLYIDPHPYTAGWFALRSTKNHMQVRNFRVVRLIPNH